MDNATAIWILPSFGRLEGRLGIDFAGLLGDCEGELRLGKFELGADLHPFAVIAGIAQLGALS